ncbi:hypothetical protein [Stenotrophomonas sp. CFBP8994]|uniref:hypothetical protein n=1 Tax=Stenotrophomonas sp. CFBP8994 TaxID=3096527 RepID=UPI002A6AB7E8|nr:hypothetical protein [Stenotrophomonas sp. CFBP8994]MDY0978567.1 hypothetical protein [Stenotrophomonas sp. CFBP8994]
MRKNSVICRSLEVGCSASLLLLLPLATFTVQAQTTPEVVSPASAVSEAAGVASPTNAPPTPASMSDQEATNVSGPALVNLPATVTPGIEPRPVEPVSREPSATIEKVEDVVSTADLEGAVEAPAAVPAATVDPTATISAPVSAAAAQRPVIPSASVEAAAPAAAASVETPSTTSPPAEPEASSEPAHVAPRPLLIPRLANENNQIERQLGARCPNDLAARLATQADLLIGACQGTLPPHLSALLVSIPEQQLLLPRTWRERQVSQKGWFKAVPGYGLRPDFLAVQGDVWVRSLEGADPSTTVYLVSGPFACADNRGPDAEPVKTVRLPAGSCREGLVQQRVYRVSAGAAPVDITQQALPAEPLLSDADRKRYGADGARVQLDAGKLQFGPALRWYVDVGTTEKPEPRSYGEWGRLHLGFAVWNGERFEPRDTVPRVVWPCDPVAPGDASCGAYADAGRDPFIVVGASAQGVTATP